MKLYGCNNSERKDGYWVLARKYHEDGGYSLHPEYIEDKSTKSCQWSIHYESTRCEGCKK